MNRWLLFTCTFLTCALLSFQSPAQKMKDSPLDSGGLIYRPGEGFSYETPGKGGKWRRENMKEQLEVAQQALEKKDYSTALKAARRIIHYQKGLSDYAPQAQYVIGRVYEARKMDEKAFKAYQTILEKYPKIANYQEVQQRQFEISVRFLNGQRFKFLGYIPLFPSMEKTAEMLEKVVKNGPYSQIGPKAQMDIGLAYEKQKNYPQAVKAYERAADRYSEQPIAAEALFKAGLAYNKQAKTAEYDQSISAKAIETFVDFKALYPEDARGTEADKIIKSLKTEQARGNFAIAKYYEKNKRWDGAVIYYNAAKSKDASSPLAAEALQRIYAINKRLGRE